MSLLRIALLQLASAGRDRDANRVRGLAACDEAAARGADVALLPEMWSIGYASFDAEAPADREAWLALAEPRDGPFVRAFADRARQHALAIGVTYLERTATAPRNALTLFDRSGREVFTYAKAHLCPWGPPDTACAPGHDFPVAALETAAGPVHVGAMTCFDREFPESARVLALRGAELILTPNACDLDDTAHGIGDVRIAQFRARAFENRVAVAMANYAEPQYDGHSVAFYPDGGEIVCAGAEPGVVLAEIDLARVRRFRREEILRDAARRPDLYGAVVAATGEG